MGIPYGILDDIVKSHHSSWSNKNS